MKEYSSINRYRMSLLSTGIFDIGTKMSQVCLAKRMFGDRWNNIDYKIAILLEVEIILSITKLWFDSTNLTARTKSPGIDELSRIRYVPGFFPCKYFDVPSRDRRPR